jgi:hypothetical protein
MRSIRVGSPESEPTAFTLIVDFFLVPAAEPAAFDALRELVFGRVVAVFDIRDPTMSYGLLVLEPVDCCGEAEHAHEG